MKKKKGRIPIIVGLFFLLCALVLTVYNFFENSMVQAKDEALLSELEEQIPSAAEENEIPYYLLDPNVEMPTQTVNGNEYIGTVEIPACGVKLPVISEWSESALKIAPCRYFGTAYAKNMVIAAHNYRAHFGRLSELNIGDEVVFTDIDGNVFIYEVAYTESLPANAVEEMTSGEWDLTLFTCNYGGSQRITVRCDSKQTQ